MPSDKAQLFFVDNFTGGLNIRSNDSMLREIECTELLNYAFPFRGGIKKRNGSLKYNASAIGLSGEVHSLYRYYKADLTKQFLAIEGSILYEGNDGAGTWTDRGSVGGSEKAAFVTYQDIVYFVNAAGLVKTWNGTAQGAVALSPTTCKYITFRKERLYAAGDSSKPNRLFYTDVALPGTWDTGNNFIDISDNDGDVITGIATLSDVLVVYKHNSIWLVYGTSNADFAVQQVSSFVGCDAPHTLNSYENKHYFLDKTGVYIFDGSNLALISENIYNDVTLKVIGLSDIPSARFGEAVAVMYNRQYYLSYSKGGETSNANMFVYNLLLNAWSRFEGISASSFATWNGVGDDRELYSGDYAGFVHKLDEGLSDNGADIETKYTSKYVHFGNPMLHKRIEEVVLTNEATDISVLMVINVDWGNFAQSIPFDASPAIALFDTAVFDTAVFAHSKNITRRKTAKSVSPNVNKGRAFSITLQETSSGSLTIISLGAIFSQESSNYGKRL